jgi:hypothetical protein
MEMNVREDGTEGIGGGKRSSLSMPPELPSELRIGRISLKIRRTFSTQA